jgi:hypothetical protein
MIEEGDSVVATGGGSVAKRGGDKVQFVFSDGLSGLGSFLVVGRGTFRS